jgi:hypothetical protein
MVFKNLPRKVCSLFIFLLGALTITYGQANKPSLMILPSDNWCEQRYFMTEFDNMGTKQKVPNYKQAFQEDKELVQVISKISSLMIDRGFPLKDAEQEIKNYEARSLEDNMTTSTSSNSSYAESPLDKLKNRVKSDLILQIWWSISKTENGKVVSFTLDAVDAYTGKKVAASTGISQPNKTDILPTILMGAINSNIDPFVSQLQQHFQDILTNGREVRLSIRRWANWDKNLETEVNGEEIRNHVYDWLQKNTNKGRFNELSSTENRVDYDQVRIPLFDERNRPIDARQFLVGLQKYFKAAPFSIDSKVLNRGIGEAILILGEK